MLTKKNTGLRKVRFFIPVLALITLLTFICVAPGKVYAAQTGEITPTTVPSTNDPDVIDATDDDDQGVSGTIGNLHFEFDTDDEDGNSWSTTLRIILVLTVISLAPSILIMMTSFTRM